MIFSRFNIWASVNDNLILYNTLTGALATFDVDNKESMQRALENSDIPSVDPNFIEGMVEDGYIVDDNTDELDGIRLAVENRQSKTDEFSLCVTLNKKCNFCCPYCFQTHNGKSLSDDGKMRIVRMFENILGKAKKIELDWFGGEPLISFKEMKKMNNYFIGASKEYGVEYSYSITTNGYLLSDKVIDYLLREKPSQITITLDGPPEVHNLSRPLKKGKETFNVIFENIKKAVTAGLNVSIRVNVTSKNVGRIPELFYILENNNLKNRVKVDLQAVVSSEAHPYEEFCLEGYELAHSIMTIYLEEAKKGWIVFPPAEDMRVLGFCIGEFPNRYITDMEGNIYKCPQMSENFSVGKIQEDGEIKINEKENTLWIDKDLLVYEECRSCSFLPLCMGGCNLKRIRRENNYCFDRKYDIPTFLELLLLNEENLSLLSKEDEKT